MSASCATYLLVVPPTPLLVVLWFAQQHTGLSLYEQFLPRVRVTTSCTSTEGEGATVWHGVGWARTTACLSALATAFTSAVAVAFASFFRAASTRFTSLSSSACAFFATAACSFASPASREFPVVR